MLVVVGLIYFKRFYMFHVALHVCNVIYCVSPADYAAILIKSIIQVWSGMQPLIFAQINDLVWPWTVIIHIIHCLSKFDLISKPGAPNSLQLDLYYPRGNVGLRIYTNNLKYEWIILLKNDFWIPKVKWLQYTGEVGKCTSYWCQIFSGFNTPKIIKIG